MSAPPRTSLLEAKKKEWAAQADMSLTVHTPDNCPAFRAILTLLHRLAVTSIMSLIPSTKNNLLLLKRAPSAPVSTSASPLPHPQLCMHDHGPTRRMLSHLQHCLLTS